MTRARRTGAALATLVAVALIGAGCSSSGSSKQTEQTTANAGQNQINPIAYDKVKQGGNLNYPLSGKIVNFNDNEVDGNTLDCFNLMNAVLPTMFTTDAANNFKANPDYLVGEPVLSTSPTQTVTYKINPKAVWSDGTQITYKDFQAQWQALNGTNTAFKYVSTQGYDQVTSVARGATDQDVIVTFKANYADWKGLFGLLYPAATNSDPATFNSGWLDKPLISAGPFMFDSQDATAQTYKIVPNPKWWGRKPKLDSITFRVVDPDAQADALNNKEVDFMDIGPNAANYARVKTFAGVDIRSAGGPNFRHVTINGSSPELQDVNVRQALAMGIDRNAIASALLTPLGVQNPSALNNHVYMKNQAGYQDNSGDVGKFNPTAAAQKLTDAGWVVQGDHRVKGGKTLTINFVIPTSVATSASEALLIQQQLAQIQVKVKVNAVDVNHFFDQYVAPGNFDFTVFSWIGSSFPISGAAGIYANQIKGNWGQNFARVGSDNIDQLFKTAEADLDPAQAIKDANAADVAVWQEVHSLTTYQRPDIWGVNTKLANFGAFGFASVDFTAIGFSS